MERLLDNASHLSRFKVRSGVGRSSVANVPGFILLCKLKRALHNEYTQGMFAEDKRKTHSKKSRVNRVDRINKLINRMERLPLASVKFLYECYDESGVRTLITELSKPIAILKKANVKSMDTI